MSLRIEEKLLHKMLTSWHGMSPKNKLKLYNSLHPQEVNIFLRIRDREFFEETVRGSLVSKIEKTVVDHALLGNLEELASIAQFGKIGSLTTLELVLTVFAFTDIQKSKSPIEEPVFQQALTNLKQECENRKLVFEMSEFDERSN